MNIDFEIIILVVMFMLLAHVWALKQLIKALEKRIKELENK